MSGLSPPNRISSLLSLILLLLTMTSTLVYNTSSSSSSVLDDAISLNQVISTKPRGCDVNKCGEVDIPYPFGIGPHCSANPFFDITCRSITNSKTNASAPFLTHLNLQVLALADDYFSQYITVYYPPIKICSGAGATTRPLFNLTTAGRSSPYRLQGGDPYDLVVRGGCGAGVAVFTGEGKMVRECKINCNPNGVSSTHRKHNCTAPMPPHQPIESYHFRLTHAHCASVALIGTAPVNPFGNNHAHSLSLLWTAKDLNKSHHVSCDGDTCRCQDTYLGNPYLFPDGCQLVEECRGCGGVCSEYTVLDQFLSVTQTKYACMTNQNNMIHGDSVIAGIVRGIAILILTCVLS